MGSHWDTLRDDGEVVQGLSCVELSLGARDPGSGSGSAPHTTFNLEQVSLSALGLSFPMFEIRGMDKNQEAQ